MNSVKQTVLKFSLRFTGNPMEVFSRFHPQGKTVLNRTEWRNKEARSCAVRRVKNRPSATVPGLSEWNVEVTYRPKGTITYFGSTKYDGWTAMMLDRAKDGTLLDGHGKPLPDGQPPVLLPFEVFEDADFNEIDFGEFVGEFGVDGIRHLKTDEVHQQIQASGRFSASIESSVIAPGRHRPQVKIILSNAPSGMVSDQSGSRIVNVNNLTPQLQLVILDHLTELVSGVIEGRYAIKSVSNDEFVFAELDDVLVDCTPNEQGKESRFNILREYVTEPYLEDLAVRLMGTYEVEVGVVDGPRMGLLLKHVPTAR